MAQFEFVFDSDGAVKLFGFDGMVLDLGHNGVYKRGLTGAVAAMEAQTFAFVKRYVDPVNSGVSP